MAKETCGYIVLGFGVLALMVYVGSMLGYLFPALTFGSRPESQHDERQRLVDEAQSSGASLASLTCAGQIGGLYFRGPLLSLDVRPAGIVIWPTIGSTALKWSEIKQLKYERHFWNTGLVIIHTSRAVQSPIFLHGVREDSPFAQTLTSMVAKEHIQPQ